MKKLEIKRSADSAAFLPKIDLAKADAEFLISVKSNSDIYELWEGENCVGIAEIGYGTRTFLYIYIFHEYCKQGYAKRTVQLVEQEILAGPGKDIVVCCRSDDPAAQGLLAALGYEKWYESDCMHYCGPAFDLPELPVRPYRDKDYDIAHAFYAEAFHRMRISVGYFPDSIPEAPSEAMRANWNKTADERLVYIENDVPVAYAHVEGCEISSVSVKTEKQGQGIGRQFVKHIVNLLRSRGYEEITLYCVVGNGKARKLYDSLGFEKIHRNTYAIKRLKD